MKFKSSQIDRQIGFTFEVPFLDADQGPCDGLRAEVLGTIP